MYLTSFSDCQCTSLHPPPQTPLACLCRQWGRTEIQELHTLLLLFNWRLRLPLPHISFVYSCTRCTLVDNSASNEQDHRFLQSCPAGCKPNGQSFTQVYKSGSFTRGPYTVPWGHKKSTLVVGGMCHSGCRRLNAVVTSKNKDAVACGKFNAAYHDASPAKWLKPYDSKDCRLNIPYCEHAWSKGTCVYKIYEKCDPL